MRWAPPNFGKEIYPGKERFAVDERWFLIPQQSPISNIYIRSHCAIHSTSADDATSSDLLTHDILPDGRISGDRCLTVTQWTKVVTEPVGLAGFALFLAFLAFKLLLTKRKTPQAPSIGLFFLILVTLIGGLAIASYKARSPKSSTELAPSTPTVNKAINADVHQESSGVGAVNAVGVQGQITVLNGSPALNQPVSKTATKRQQ